MDTRLDDVLRGREGNYLFPFYWQRGDHRDRIPSQIARIFESGCRALCVESRPHPDFCGEGWWRDMDVVLDECARRGMKVWILDDKRFPTGFANGLIESKYPDLAQRTLVERHVDVMGPAPGTAMVAPRTREGDVPLGVRAYRRAPGGGQRLCGDPVDLSGRVRDGLLRWDVPEGCWRVFWFWRSRRGISPGRIDPLSRESCAVLLEAVYEPHFAHYGDRFGSVVAGFFSDEPQFHDWLVGEHLRDGGLYTYSVGQEGLALPYSDALAARMSASLGEDAAARFGELWYESPDSPRVRLAYMDAATSLYRENLSLQLGDWCRAHGVEYVGHVIEDMNAHGRLGYGPGHYFRAMAGQDMGGCDIVLHQVLPGFGDYPHTASALGGCVSPDFFHCVLPRLAASAAHQSPRMRGRAMCEVFGAYGWAEGAPTMRWLLDFLLVRGINRFVPHAFSPSFPDPDCPPHFGAEGRDPQLDGFGALMRYANKAAHLLEGGRRVVSAAILYHAEAEWMAGVGRAMLDEVPARALSDANLDFSIVCADALLDPATALRDGRLAVGDETIPALVVPAAPFLPPRLVARLRELAAAGLPVLFVDSVAADCADFGRAVPLDGLADAVRAAAGGADVAVEGAFPHLRALHVERDGADAYLFFNESPDVRAATRVRLRARGEFARLRLLEDVAESGTSPDGEIDLDLVPGQSEIVIFGGRAGLPAPRPVAETRPLRPRFAVSVADCEDLASFRPLCETDELFDLAAPDRIPDFAGKARYAFSVDFSEADLARDWTLDLGRVGQTARLFLNGADAGIRIAAPFRFALRGLVAGRNDFVVETASTLVRRIKDDLSFFLPIPPEGLLGPLALYGSPVGGGAGR